MSLSENRRFARILKSTSILGSASIVNVVVGIIRVKVLAVQLGPALFGVMSLYSNFVAMIGSVASLGIGQSAVRDIAKASSSGDESEVSRKISLLRKVVWITGLMGFVVTLCTSIPASRWIFGSYDHAWAIAMLSIIVLFSQIESGQSALLSGLRRIPDLARIKVIGAIVSTVLALFLLLLFRESGIVPFLISVAAGQLAVSWWYARKIVVTKILVTWRECYDESREMVQLGLAMVTSNVALTVSTMVILVIVRNYEGVAAVGLYQSAITISSIYIGFILQGMSGDYFPRLVAVADDRDGRNQVVCEQAEMAMLLAVPGLIGVLIFSSLLVATLYSSRFDGASEILGWLVLGMLGRIVSWPQGFILFARSDKAALIYTELLTALFHVSMVLLAVRYFGVVGAGMSFAAQYGLHVWLISWIVKHKHAFVLLKRTRSIVITGTALVMVSFGTSYIQLPVIRYTCGIAVFVFAIAWSLRGLAKRLGSSQVMRVVERVARLPMLGFVERIFAYLLKKG